MNTLTATMKKSKAFIPIIWNSDEIIFSPLIYVQGHLLILIGGIS